MKPRIEVFDPPMCCSTGVCGAVVDPALPRFAGDLSWLARNGLEIARHNLAQEPQAFTTNDGVLAILKGSGSDALPLVLVDGAVMSQGRYPSREEMASWTGLPFEAPDAAPPSLSLPTVVRRDPDDGTGCCG
ncbi:MAG TPA: arsenite efflux transporter metallochaperone ArsD [Thermoanaerobaculia bacterium]|jgi:Arsenical resistance operon protein ArsD